MTAALGHAGVAVARASSVAALLPRVEACLEATAALHRQVVPAADLLCAARVTLEIDLRALRSRPASRS